jgi:hypothetical protein
MGSPLWGKGDVDRVTLPRENSPTSTSPANTDALTTESMSEIGIFRQQSFGNTANSVAFIDLPSSPT